YFFFQAEDGIRDRTVTGVQTCALPICARRSRRSLKDSKRPLRNRGLTRRPAKLSLPRTPPKQPMPILPTRRSPTRFRVSATKRRSEERRVGKEDRCRRAR